MSMPTFPECGKDITQEQAFNMLLGSIAMEELALSHILNAEGEKLQYFLGTLPGQHCDGATLREILEVNRSITNLLENVMHNQLLLKTKLQLILEAKARWCPHPRPEPEGCTLPCGETPCEPCRTPPCEAESCQPGGISSCEEISLQSCDAPLCGEAPCQSRNIPSCAETLREPWEIPSCGETPHQSSCSSSHEAERCQSRGHSPYTEASCQTSSFPLRKEELNQPRDGRLTCVFQGERGQQWSAGCCIAWRLAYSQGECQPSCASGTIIFPTGGVYMMHYSFIVRADGERVSAALQTLDGDACRTLRIIEPAEDDCDETTRLFGSTMLYPECGKTMLSPMIFTLRSPASVRVEQAMLSIMTMHA